MKFISLLLFFMTLFTATQSVTVLPVEEAVIIETDLTDAGSVLTEHIN